MPDNHDHSDYQDHHPPTMLFVAIFCTGVVVLGAALIVKQLHSGKSPDIETLVVLGEHLASAVIVAALMGMSYERFVHGHIMESFKTLLETQEQSIDATMAQHREELQATIVVQRTELETVVRQQRKELELVIDEFRTTTAQEVLSLLRDIAERQPGMPTLYYPPRDETHEFVFSTHVTFFQRLTSTPQGRSQAIETLRVWVDPKSSLCLRFLGSDFVGLLQLNQLAQDLRDVVTKIAPEWKDLKPDSKSCILNYIWAASRCDTPIYAGLSDLLLRSDDPFVLEWILFVPRQMPEPALGDMLERFVRERGGDISCDILKLAVFSIGALHRAGVDMQLVADNQAAVFAKCNLTDLLKSEMSALPVPRPHGIWDFFKS